MALGLLLLVAGGILTYFLISSDKSPVKKETYEENEQSLALNEETTVPSTELEENVPDLYSFYEIVGTLKNGRAIVGKKGKFGFIDSQGNEIVPCVYDEAKSYSDGLALVSKDGKSYFIDYDGNVAIDGDFVPVGPFSDGLAPVAKDGYMGYINTNGEIIIPYSFKYARPFSDGVALVNPGSELPWLFLDTTGKYIDYTYEDAKSFSEGFAAVKENGAWHYILTRTA